MREERRQKWGRRKRWVISCNSREGDTQCANRRDRERDDFGAKRRHWLNRLSDLWLPYWREKDIIERRNKLRLLTRRLLIGQPGKHAFQRDDGLANGFQPFDTIRLGGTIPPEQGMLKRNRQMMERHQTDRRRNPAQGMSGTGHFEGGWRKRMGIERGIAFKQGLQVAAGFFKEDVVERLRRRRGDFDRCDFSRSSKRLCALLGNRLGNLLDFWR